MAVIPQRYRFTVNQYHRMADAGIFTPMPGGADQR